MTLAIAGAAVLLASAGAASATPYRESSGSVSAVQGRNTTLFSTSETGGGRVTVAENSETGFDAAATAATDFRVNRATALANKRVVDGFPESYARDGLSSAQARSTWRDDIILNALTPTVGIAFVFKVSGALSGGALASFDFDFDVDDVTCCGDSTSAIWRNPILLDQEEIVLVAEAEAGVPIGISAELIADASVGRNDLGSAFATFGASAILVEVIVPEGVTIESASGTDYMTPIPEPGTAVLAILGAGVLALLSPSGRPGRPRAGSPGRPGR